MRTLVWFRGKDLRLSDHVPLSSALKSSELIPLFVLDPYFFAPARAQRLPHRMQFLLASLQELADELARRGSRLIVLAGKSVELLPRLVETWKVERVVAQRWVEPFARERDRRIRAALGARFELTEGETLLRPGSLRTAAGKPYGVFGQFRRAFARSVRVAAALDEPSALPPLPRELGLECTTIPTCAELGITENAALLAGGTRAAQARLELFLRQAAAGYAIGRDRLDRSGTSRLSADLKFGTISVRRVWSAIEQAHGASESGQTFLDELVWREFAYSTLWDRPDLLERPFQQRFAAFPWLEDELGWQAWVQGRTGYPIVDAAARQLLAEGFVPNRARMIAASFLTKHLLIDYRRGEAHYLEYLTDGDWANNNLGWQWSAGCGVDAQPYFRVFNPVTQGQKFDPEGRYVRRFVPELEGVPAEWIHRPWEAPEAVLTSAGVRLGTTYPRPIVEHRVARERFLSAAKQLLGGASAEREPVQRAGRSER